MDNKIRCNYCGSREFEIKELFEITISEENNPNINLKNTRNIYVCAECGARLDIIKNNKD